MWGRCNIPDVVWGCLSGRQLNTACRGLAAGSGPRARLGDCFNDRPPAASVSMPRPGRTLSRRGILRRRASAATGPCLPSTSRSSSAPDMTSASLDLHAKRSRRASSRGSSSGSRRFVGVASGSGGLVGAMARGAGGPRVLTQRHGDPCRKRGRRHDGQRYDQSLSAHCPCRRPCPWPFAAGVGGAAKPQAHTPDPRDPVPCPALSRCRRCPAAGPGAQNRPYYGQRGRVIGTPPPNLLSPNRGPATYESTCQTLPEALQTAFIRRHPRLSTAAEFCSGGAHSPLQSQRNNCELHMGSVEAQIPRVPRPTTRPPATRRCPLLHTASRLLPPALDLCI